MTDSLRAGATVVKGALLLILLTIVATGCRARTGNDKPDIQILSAEQLRSSLHLHREALTLVHVWATWCPPCREEFPVVVRFRDDYAARGVSVILVSADPPAQKDAVARYLAEMGASFPSYIIDNPSEEFINILCNGWSGAIPASFFFGPRGELRQWWDGVADFEKYRETADVLLGTNK